MNERITEQYLAEIDHSAAFLIAEPDIARTGLQVHGQAIDLRRLVAEVRRLRGLIVVFAGNSGYDTACVGCGNSATAIDEPGHDPNCPWKLLEAEARAIGEEKLAT